MRRPVALFAAIFGLGLLAACGGGGGGGSTPPVSTPATSNPGPSSHPSSSPSPTASPAPTGTPGSTPSPTPSTSPTLTPTQSPPPTATPQPTPTPGPSATPNSKLTVGVGNGQINGSDDQILTSAPNTHNNKGEGDLEPGDPGAQPSGGGQGAPVDQSQSFPWGNGIPSATTMSDNYHVHAFLGLYVNGQEVAIPDGIGMVNPVGDFNYNNGQNPCTGGANNFECYADAFYYIHTHDASGAIHMEAPQPVCGIASGWTTQCSMSLFTLGNVLDVWGVSIGANNFGPFIGPVTIYTSPLGKAASCTTNPCYTPSNTYSLYTGDPTSIQLYSHTVVWILVGSANPTGASLPNIEWYLAQ